MLLKKILFNLRYNKKVNLNYSNSDNNDIEVELLHKTPIFELSQTILNIRSDKRESIYLINEYELENNLEKNKITSYEINKNLIDFLDNKDEQILKCNILIFKVKVGNSNLFSNFIFNTLTELINNNLYIVKKSDTEFIIYGNYISFYNIINSNTSNPNKEDIVLYSISKEYNKNFNPIYYNIDEKKFNEILNYISDIQSYHIYVIDHYSIDVDNNYICFATDNKDIIKVIRLSNYYHYIISNIIEDSCYIVNISEKNLFNIIKENYITDGNIISSTLLNKLYIVVKELLNNITIYDINDMSFDNNEDIGEENNSQYYKDIDEIIDK